MLPDPDTCYHAYRSRDGRFDGRFFVGVRTTGVYCRPVCPARSPKRENVDFYACAAAAEEAGFRPCRRCRPETAPGSPAWLGTSATVSRALRLIRDGALEAAGVPELAARLGVTDRHLRRLFDEHLGVSPLAIARTAQVHVGKLLLQTSTLPVGEVAAHSGFRSARQFRHAVQKTFRRSATALRDERSRPGGGLRIGLRAREPFDGDRLLQFFGPRALPGVESVVDGAWRRRVRVGAETASLAVRVARRSTGVEVSIETGEVTNVLPLVGRVRDLFDLDAAPAPIEEHFSKDRLLRTRLRRFPGLRVPGCWDPFELAVRAIIGQQVSVAGATTLAGRLVDRFGPSVGEGDEEPFRLFPPAEILAEAPVHEIGMPRARGEAIRALARGVAEGRIRLDGSAAIEECRALLAELPGVGAWTIEVIALRALRDPDAFPAGDLGVRKALGGVSARAAEDRSRAWRPWRAYATIALWAGLERPAATKG